MASGEYLSRLLGWPANGASLVGIVLIGLVTGLNLVGVAAGRWAQNLATAAKVTALAGVVLVAGVAGSGAGWRTSLPDAPTGFAVWGALALAFQGVIWTYYGYPDAAKIAEEVEDPGRRLPLILLAGILGVTALYLLLNAAFLQVLPMERIASSTLVAGDVASEIFGARAGVVMAALALLVVLASLNGNVFVTPRVIFGLARDGLGPSVLARVNAGGTPWTAMILVGVVASALAATGTFEKLLSLAIVFILVIDGFMVLVLFRLRRLGGEPAFRVPLYPVLTSSWPSISRLPRPHRPGEGRVVVEALAESSCGSASGRRGRIHAQAAQDSASREGQGLVGQAEAAKDGSMSGRSQEASRPEGVRGTRIAHIERHRQKTQPSTRSR